MMPRPNWFTFISQYLRLCVLILLVALLVMGVPVVLVVSWMMSR